MARGSFHQSTRKRGEGGGEFYWPGKTYSKRRDQGDTLILTVILWTFDKERRGQRKPTHQYKDVEVFKGGSRFQLNTLVRRGKGMWFSETDNHQVEEKV